MIDDRTQQELKDNDYISFESDAEDSDIEEIDTTSALDQNKTSIGRPGPIIKFSTDYNRKIKAANKIKNKYFKKNIGQRNKKNNVSTKWLKFAGYLDTKDQDKLNYIFVRPKNKTPKSDGVLLTTEIDSTDFKKENLTTKIKKNIVKKPFVLKEKKETPDETIQLLDKIATLEPGKNAQMAAKKISEKYKKLREANARKKKYKIPGEIVKIEEFETPQGKVKVPVSIEKSKNTAKKIIKKYDKIRREKKIKKIVDVNKKRKKTQKIDTINEIKNSAAKKSAKKPAKKIVEKYKSMKRPKKTQLVSEKDLETIDYNEPQEDLFKGESIVEAANKVLDFQAFKKDQAAALNDLKKRVKKALP